MAKLDITTLRSPTYPKVRSGIFTARSHASQGKKANIPSEQRIHKKFMVVLQVQARDCWTSLEQLSHGTVCQLRILGFL